MRQKIVAGNWKMNGRLADVKQLLTDLRAQLPHLSEGVACVLLPPAIYIPLTSDYLQDSPIQWGGQNVYPALQGAYTGEHSLLMFKDYDCRYLLVGHSERRQLFCETEKFIAEKFHLIKEHGMIPLLCVGETLQERTEGNMKLALKRQLSQILENDSRSFENAVIAYEPVWAIGTGRTATPEEVQEAHSFIREQISLYHENDAMRVPLLYGGSVNETNAAQLFAMPDVDGGLIGGASLNARQFVEIVKCIN